MQKGVEMRAATSPTRSWRTCPVSRVTEGSSDRGKGRGSKAGSRREFVRVCILAPAAPHTHRWCNAVADAASTTDTMLRKGVAFFTPSQTPLTTARAPPPTPLRLFPSLPRHTKLQDDLDGKAWLLTRTRQTQSSVAHDCGRNAEQRSMLLYCPPTPQPPQERHLHNTPDT